MPWEERAAVFLRAAELLAGDVAQTIERRDDAGPVEDGAPGGDRRRVRADRLLALQRRVRVAALRRAADLVAGRVEPAGARPLEGFVFAVTPFNFTAIGGNLPTAPALMGNTVVWKPATTAMFSAYYIMQIFEEAGLPPGVINLVHGLRRRDRRHGARSPRPRRRPLHRLDRRVQRMWKTIGDNIASYNNYPRIVGETGGKDFIVAHPSADATRSRPRSSAARFEYQGQKCSAASRVYVAVEPLERHRERLPRIGELKMGDVADFANFMGAVIEEARSRRTRARSRTREPKATGRRRRRRRRQDGWFVRPTRDRTEDPNLRLMREELFGPIVTIYVYPDGEWKRRSTSSTHVAVRADRCGVPEDRAAIDKATRRFATRPATSTSTTSRPAPSSASSHSAAGGLPPSLFLLARVQLDQLVEILDSEFGIVASAFSGVEVARRLGEYFGDPGELPEGEHPSYEVATVGEAVDLRRALRAAEGGGAVGNGFAVDGSITITV